MVSPYTGNTYTILSGYDLSHGIDVSKYQTDVDWAAVKADGIDSVMIRCAFRGYGTEGTLVEDSSFTTHIEGALAAGLHVGAYIYSQAITEAEGQEEARKCLDLCSSYLDQMDMPIVMDVEYANDSAGALIGRLYNADLSNDQQTAICQAFANVIYEAGYQPMIYANASYLTDEMNASALTDEGTPIWLAHYTTATGYRVYRKVSGGSWKKLKDTANLTYTDTTAVTGTTYYYTVRAYRTVNGSNVWSSYVKAGISAKAIPATPKLSGASSLGYNKIKVSWNKVAGATGYRVYRKVSGGSWLYLGDTTTALSYTDEWITTGTTYYYTVRAYRTVDGTKIWGNYDTAGVSGKAIPATPSLTSTSSLGYNSIKVTWGKVSGATGYRVYRKVSGGSWKMIADSLTALTYTDKTAVTGTTYYYTVKAYRTVNGSRVWSSYVKAGISGKAIPATPSVSLSSTSTGKVKVFWNKISGASGYAVYRKNLTTGKWERIKNITSASTLSYTASGTSGKNVYYTVRAYRTVNGTNVYSKYKTNVYIKVK